MAYKIIRVRNGFVSIASNDGTFFNVSIEELDFEPKVGDEVQCFRNGEKVIVFKNENSLYKQNQIPGAVPKNESSSNLHASVEVSAVPKTGLQGHEQNTPIGNPFSEEIVEKKSRAPWIIGIILLLLGILFICIHMNNSGALKGTKIDSHDGTTYKAIVKGTMTDSRDGRTYKTVKIGRQTWMAENLNYNMQNGACYDNEALNCSIYGHLYYWNAAIKACPSGWHLPNDAEFKTLLEFVGGQSIADAKLKSMSGWDDGSNGTDDFGFSALPAGNWDWFGSFNNKGECTMFWSSTEFDKLRAGSLELDCSRGDYGAVQSFQVKRSALSVRCIQN